MSIARKMQRKEAKKAYKNFAKNYSKTKKHINHIQNLALAPNGTKAKPVKVMLDGTIQVDDSFVQTEVETRIEGPTGEGKEIKVGVDRRVTVIGNTPIFKDWNRSLKRAQKHVNAQKTPEQVMEEIENLDWED